MQNNWEPEQYDLQPFTTIEPEEEVEERPPSNFARGCLRFLLDVVETIALAVLLYLAINAVAARVRVQGRSMYPTFKGGEFILVYRLAYHNSLPHRGDIIVFHPEMIKKQGFGWLNVENDFIKRVIGLPGEEVKIYGGKVYINGKPLKEPYIAEPPRYTGVWKIPKGKVFVLGDNRNNSTDSHVFGPVPIKYIIGRAVFIYYPPGEWGIIRRVQYDTP